MGATGTHTQGILPQMPVSVLRHSWMSQSRTAEQKGGTSLDIDIFVDDGEDQIILLKKPFKIHF